MSRTIAYAAPLVAVDQIVEISEEAIRTMKTIVGDEPFFLGHYPHFPVFPGVFVVEAVHQTARLFVSEALRLPLHAELVQIRSARFLSPLRPGDVLEVDARCRHEREVGELIIEAECWRRETPPVAVAQIKLRCALES